jgi:hypothetical protein
MAMWNTIQAEHYRPLTQAFLEQIHTGSLSAAHIQTLRYLINLEIHQHWLFLTERRFCQGLVSPSPKLILPNATTPEPHHLESG